MNNQIRKARLENNLRVMALHRTLLVGYSFAVPVIVLFFQDYGLTIGDVLLLEAVFAIALAAFEVPSGYIADYFGRKKTIVAGAAIASVSAAVYLLSNDFTGFLIAEILIALGLALNSGADEALFYDSLTELERESECSRRWGEITAYEFVVVSVCMLLGGTLGAYYHRLPFAFTLLALTALLFNALRFEEPRKEKLLAQEGHLRELLSIGYVCLVKHRRLRDIIWITAVLHALNQAGFWLHQPLFQVKDISVVWFGTIFASLNVAAAIVARNISAFEQRYSALALGTAAAVIAGLSGVLLALIKIPAVIALILSFQLIRVLNRVLFMSAMNKEIESQARATAVSVGNFVKCACYSAVLLALGPFAEAFGVERAIGLIGGLLLACAGLLTIAGRSST